MLQYGERKYALGQAKSPCDRRQLKQRAQRWGKQSLDDKHFFESRAKFSQSVTQCDNTTFEGIQYYLRGYILPRVFQALIDVRFSSIYLAAEVVQTSFLTLSLRHHVYYLSARVFENMRELLIWLTQIFVAKQMTTGTTPPPPPPPSPLCSV
jgi:hypothetical protein